MTRVLIPAPAIEADVSAEQVVAYLLARGWSRRPSRSTWLRTAPDGCVTLGSVGSRNQLQAAIKAIARAEQRHPSAVLADIVGPARAASVGAVCRGEEDREQKFARARCHVRMASARYREEQTEQEAKRAAWEAAHLYVDTAEDSAAHGAGESEE